MKILAFSDLHCRAELARKCVELAADCQLVLGAGDFANQHRGLEITLDILQEIQCPAVLVPGNNETREALQLASENWANAHVLHGDRIELAGLEIVGIGGGIPVTPFGDWSYDFSDAEAEELLREFEAADIIIAHSPPQGLVDVDSKGIHRGSQALRECIHRLGPKLYVCGHIHDSWQAMCQYEGCQVMNLGPEPQLIELD